MKLELIIGDWFNYRVRLNLSNMYSIYLLTLASPNTTPFSLLSFVVQKGKHDFKLWSTFRFSICYLWISIHLQWSSYLWISSLKWESGRLSKYTSTAAITSSSNEDSFTRIHFLGCGNSLGVRGGFIWQKGRILQQFII